MSSTTSRTDRILSVSAVVAALAAVAVSVYQAGLAREQQRASAWPYVMQANSFSSGPYTRFVENAGVGPALVGSFRVLVDDEPVPDWGTAVERLLAAPDVESDAETAAAPDSGLVYSSFGAGVVLPAGASRTLVTLPPGDRARRFWEASQERLATRVCYCSVYDECWTADSRDPAPAPVRACHAGDGEFTQ